MADDALSRGRWDGMTSVEQYDYVVGLERALVERDRYRSALMEIATFTDAELSMAGETMRTVAAEALDG